jgi:hypothetical protein
MTYRIARAGQVFGPYTATEVREYLAVGRLLPSDLTQAEGAAQWVALRELFPETVWGGAAVPGAAGRVLLFPDPPDLPWWVALLLGVVTGGLFFVIWDIVEARWMRRVARVSTALGLYLAVAVLYLFRVPANWHMVAYNVGLGPPVTPTALGGLLGMAGVALAIAARFVFRGELLRHFNGTEPLGLRLNAFWTLLFGGLYFQFHFNRINERKRAMRISVPGA